MRCESHSIGNWPNGRVREPERKYCGLVIRRLQNRTFRKWGLPKDLLLEGGIWQRAKVVRNEAPQQWAGGLSPPSVCVGWEKLGVRIRRATRARTKQVELVGGLLQNLLDGLPGYAGRDERHDLPEATKKAMQAVAGKHVHPDEYFLS